MSETITKKKKKEKKEYDYEAVVKRLRPYVKKMRKAMDEFYDVLYDEYLECPNFTYLCELLNVPLSTAYDKFNSKGLPLKRPDLSEKISESKQQVSELKTTLVPIEQDDGSISFEEPEEPDMTVKLETDVDFGKYQETYRRIRKIEEISLVDFKVGKDYRQKLIDILREAKEHLEELLDTLEVEKP